MTDKSGENISFCELITASESESLGDWFKLPKLEGDEFCDNMSTESDGLSKTTWEIGVDELVDMIFSSSPRVVCRRLIMAR